MSLKSDLIYWLNKYNVQPNKNLGQCFLISEKSLSQIGSSADIHVGDKILEIGAGTGTLTQKLLEKGARVLAIEKDTRLFKILNDRFSKDLKSKKLILIHADFLKLKFPDFLMENNFARGKYKVVANLPYQITSPVLERLLERKYLPAEIILTIQKEVAERINAKPGNLSSLAVLVQTCAQKLSLVARFPKSHFYPQPEISSALIKLEGLAYPKGVEIKKLRQVIRAGFSQKRKKLKKNLQQLFSKILIDKIWKKLKLPENIRAQELEVEKWIELAKKSDGKG